MPIFSVSGIRGIYGKDLNFKVVKKIAMAYGLWLNNKNKKVVIGIDTRRSGTILKKAVISGLLSTNCSIIDLGICPSPILIFTKNKLSIAGGIIISGSHNPPEWNALKLLSNKTFLNTSELKVITDNLNKIKQINFPNKLVKNRKTIKKLNSIPLYLQELYKNINLKNVIPKNNLRIIVDNGAGTSKYVIPLMLKDLNCKVKYINNDLTKTHKFPRGLDPNEENLKDLIGAMKTGDYDVGFAYDSDADRLAIVGDDAKFYQLDIGLALITEYYFKNYYEKRKEMIFVTNLASSLIFDELANKYNAKIIRTPIGERNLAEKMNDFLVKHQKSNINSMVFGGEGSCGGIMLPSFNNTRDGIFATAKIIEILINYNDKISNLIAKLPKYFKFQENVFLKNINIDIVINKLREQLKQIGENFNQIEMDLRLDYGKEAFVLIHPSNTEPLIRVISESKIESNAKKNLEKILTILGSIINKNK